MKVSAFSSGAPAQLTDILGAVRGSSNVKLTVDDVAKAATSVFNVKSYGAVGDGVTDDTVAIQAAISAANTAGGGTVIFPKPSSNYKITTALTLNSNVRLLGLGVRPTIKLILSGSSHVISASSVSNAWVENLTLDGTKFTVTSGNCIRFDTCTGGGAKDCHIKDSKAQGIYIFDSSVGVEVSSCDFSGTEGIALSMDTSSYLKIFKNDFTGGSSFCIFGFALTDSQIEGNSTNDSVLELIGLRYNCSRNRVINNHAYDTDDNGISITGSENTVTGNVCRANGGSGIWIYGSDNTVTGNICFNNGQDFVNRSGIVVEGGSGGQGKNNVVTGNVCFDDQGSPTQKWGVRLGTHGYTTWANAQSISIDDYRIHGNNAYIAVSAGTTATGSEPVHTSGTVAGADTIQWTFLFTTSTSFHPTGNEVANNKAFGNITADLVDAATSGSNKSEVIGGLTTTGKAGFGQSAPNSYVHATDTGSGTLVTPIVAQNSATATNTACQIEMATSTSAAAVTGAIRTNRTVAGSTQVSLFAWNGSALVEGLRVVDDGRLNRVNGAIEKVREVTAAGAITVVATDYIILVNKSVGAATTVNLPASPSTGQVFIIKDGKGDANSNNITIVPAAGNIDGAANLVINSNSYVRT